MSTVTISQRYPKNSGMFSKNENDWGDKYLGRHVEFKLNKVTMTGEVKGIERFFLANGIHDILEIELDGETKQVKIQMHRQAVKLID